MTPVVLLVMFVVQREGTVSGRKDDGPLDGPQHPAAVKFMMLLLEKVEG